MQYPQLLIAITKHDAHTDPRASMSQSHLLKESGNFKYRAGDVDGAILDYKAAIGASDDGDKAFFVTCSSNIALAYIKKSDWQNAFKCASDAIECDSQHFKSFFRRGVALRNLGRLEEAKADFERALQLEDNSDVRRELSLCKQKNPVGALASIASALGRVSLYSDKRVGSPPPTVVSEPPQHENLKVDTTEELRDLLRIAKTNIDKPDLQTHALRDILGLVLHQPANQSAAGAAGAVGVLLQLAQSSGDKPAVQIAALEALCGVVLNHPANQIAAGEAGALHDILQLVVRSGNNLRLQKAALVAVKVVVANIPANQSAAGAAGAVGVLLQLAQSSGDKPDVQIAALEAFSPVVLNHPANQIAAGDALGHLLQLAQSSSIAASAAAIALKNLVECSFSNQQACHKIICSSHPRVPAALHSLAAQLQRTFEGSSLELSLVRKLEIWCDEARGAGGCIGAADDVFSSVPTRSTRQIGDTCFAFAAARSFNRR
jgi:hypothetical protein